MAFQLLSQSNCALLKLNDRNSYPIFVHDNRELMEFLESEHQHIFIISEVFVLTILPFHVLKRPGSSDCDLYNIFAFP
jgi:hypothetical protein